MKTHFIVDEHALRNFPLKILFSEVFFFLKNQFCANIFVTLKLCAKIFGVYFERRSGGILLLLSLTRG